MRIVIDLQACQTSGSRHRGMGRYSMALAQAMTRRSAGRHDIWLALNGCFPDSIGDIRRRFQDLLPPERIVTFQVPCRSDADGWRVRAAEAIREHFLTRLAPDIVHVSSLFEGLNDDATTATGRFPTAVTLYDLIPLMWKDVYLTSERVRDWYFAKIEHLKKAQLWLAISGHSREEAIAALDLPKDRVVNISAAIDDCFVPLPITETREQELRVRYGLNRPFLMYTGGIDFRKNIEGLIEAFALLPVHRNYQLAIVCSADEQQRNTLLAHAARTGLGPDEVVITGFVPEGDLVALYSLCHLFVFPSLHEGFGLPALEAMACGAPVIGSDTSSIPEVIGRKDALFDPTRPPAIAKAMAGVLADEGFRQELRDHGPRQACLFSWDESARRALAAFEQQDERTRGMAKHAVPVSKERPRLAYVSPLPPERTGIAEYSTELLPALASHYDITLIADQARFDLARLGDAFPVQDVAWFERNAKDFDRILYQFGNSAFHHHMFGLLDRHPGVVVLHDFFLSGVLHWLDATGAAPGLFGRSLYRAHGYAALFGSETDGVDSALLAYPGNRSVLDAATGVIVHSRYSVEAAGRWYGTDITEDWRMIPHLRVMPAQPGPQGAEHSHLRTRLGLGADDFLVCSFGIVDRTKSHERLLEAFLASELADDPHCRMTFVGEAVSRTYGDALRDRIAASPARDRIHITGYVDAETYQAYLAATDAAVQLRAWTRGETSGTVLDALGHGLALIVNACGSMAELPDDCLIKLPERFDDALLIDALHMLWRDASLRRRLGEAGRKLIATRHDPDRVALQYRDAIEAFATTGRHACYRQLIDRLCADAGESHADDDDLTSAAIAIAANHPLPHRRQILIDITGIDLQICGDEVGRLLRDQQANERVEPIHWDGRSYRYAVAATCRFLGINDHGLTDEVVEVAAGDVVDVLSANMPRCADAQAALRRWEAMGVNVRVRASANDDGY